MSESNFVCPQTQEPCLYGTFCSVRKDSMERAKRLDPDMKAYLEALPSEVPDNLQKADNSSFCSTERLAAIADAAISMTTPCGNPNPEYGDRILEWSSDMTAHVLNGRQSRMP